MRVASLISVRLSYRQHREISNTTGCHVSPAEEQRTRHILVPPKRGVPSHKSIVGGEFRQN